MVKIRLGLLFLASLLMAIGCSDDISELGSGVVPSGDNMSVGTITVKPALLSQFHPDSIQTDDLSSLMLGGLWNKDFGEFRADVVTQLRFDTILFANNENWEVDSVSLVILQNDIYGDSSAISELVVYELKKKIDNYTSYYSNANSSEYYDESGYLGELQYRPGQVDDSIKIYYTSGDSAALFRINVPIDKSYGQRLFDEFVNYEHDVDAFQDLFKGLYIKSTFGNKALNLVQISTDDDEDFFTTIALHLKHSYKYIKTYASGIKESRDTIVDVTQYFYVNDECGRFSIFHHNFDGVDVNTDYNSTVSPELVKIRGGGALTMRVKLPELRDSMTWVENDTNFIVNKAVLSIKLATSEYDYKRMVPPATLEAQLDTIGNFAYWYDNINSDGYFGGEFNDDDNSYEFNITTLVQSILSDPDYEPRDLIFYNSENAFSPWMSMFYGKDSVDIDIYYTKY